MGLSVTCRTSFNSTCAQICYSLSSTLKLVETISKVQLPPCRISPKKPAIYFYYFYSNSTNIAQWRRFTMKSAQCKAPKLLDVKSVRQTKCQNEKWQNQKLQIQMHIHIYQCMWSVIPGITCNFHVRPLCHPFPHVSEFLSGVVCGGGL